MKTTSMDSASSFELVLADGDDVKRKKEGVETMNQRAPKKPVDWDELYPGRFLKAGEFQGRKVTLRIKDVNVEELIGDNGAKMKGVISFEETPKQLALNKTNGLCLREMFGRKIPEWIGKRVTLFPSEWNSEPCIRLWGSPDISREMQIQVQLPRRKPFPMTMHVVGNGQQRQVERRPEPEPVRDEMDPDPFDPDTGEIEGEAS